MPARPSAQRLRDGDRLGGYTVLRRLGVGGNADVYEASSGDNHVALKVLRNRNGGSEPYRRFRQEASQHKRLSDNRVRGVLPLLDLDVPKDPTDARPPWLAMPIAVPLQEALGMEPRLEGVASAVAEIAATLARLHGDGIAHRDVKPSNLYRYLDGWAIGDFGLVEIPGGEPLTVGAKALGPRHFIAPEMTMRPDIADGRSADVYSLGKTLWCLATGQATPPAGEHRRELSWKRLDEWGVSHPRAYYLDRLMEAMCTEVAQSRPPMAKVAETLVSWARGPVASATPGAIDASDVAREIADVLADDQQRVGQHQARRAEVDALAARFGEHVGAFVAQLDVARLPHSGLTADHQGVSAALQRFADELKGADRVAAWRSVEVKRNTGRDQRSAFLRSGVAVALATDQMVALGAAHTIGHRGGREVVWKDVSSYVLLGSLDLDQEMRRLATGFLDAVPAVLSRYLQIIRGDDSR